ncbi:hypothetical protein [Bradyrhizobium sp. USDA 10063]
MITGGMIAKPIFAMMIGIINSSTSISIGLPWPGPAAITAGRPRAETLIHPRIGCDHRRNAYLCWRRFLCRG